MSDKYIELAENFIKWFHNPGEILIDNGQDTWELLEQWANSENIDLDNIDVDILEDTINILM